MAAAAVPQSTRKTRSDTKSLPGKPDRLIEDIILSTPKKTTEKKKATPKKTASKKAAAPKATQSKATQTKATKVTKKKSPAMAMTVKQAAAGGWKAVALNGKRRPRMAEEPLPSPVGYDDDPSYLNESFKRGVYRTDHGWFDLRKMRYLDDNESSRVQKEREQGIDAYLSRWRSIILYSSRKDPFI